MSGYSPISDDFLALLNAACDGTLSEPQLHELAAVLDSDVAARKVFAHHVQLRTDIRLLGRAEKACDGGLARVQATLTQALPSSSPSPIILFPGNAAHGTIGYISSGWPLAYLVATVIFGIGLVVGSLTHVSHLAQLATQAPPVRKEQPSTDPKMDFVGRITGMVDCRWTDSATEAFAGAYVALGRTYALSSGLAEITYDSGAKVILQGPATYKVESKDGGYLSIGKLTARVESGEWKVESAKQQAANPKSQIPNPKLLSTTHYPLFTIKTPTAIVTDLGTEFGVEVDNKGLVTTHVFRGAVNLQAISVDGRAEGIAQVLHENESARVDRGGDNCHVVLGTSADTAGFVREIPKRSIKVLDLVDVVAGGDGFSGRRNAGIDPTTGRATDTPPKYLKDFSLVDDGKYHRVEGLPFVDGVFIPDGSAGPLQTDSAGHTFAFPPTVNITAHYVWAGGAVPGPVDRPDMTFRTKLGDTDYASPGHGLVFLCTNKGITFDLEAIRRANPGCKLVRFRATAGNPEMESADGTPVWADVWVLVDGEARFRRWQINNSHGPFLVVVPIEEGERFLTLAATDGGNGTSADWIMFGDPRLELLSEGE